MKNLLYRIFLGILVNYALGCYLVNSSSHVILSISIGLSLILIFEPLILHFFEIKDYFFNNVFISFLLLVGGLLFFGLVAFYKLSFREFTLISGVLLYSLLSSIIYNLMYYLRK